VSVACRGFGASAGRPFAVGRVIAAIEKRS